MFAQCLPPSFALIWLTIPKKMSSEDFQAGRHDVIWTSERNYFSNSELLCCCVASQGMVLAIQTLHVSLMPPTSFGLIWLTVWEQMSFENFQGCHGSHLGYCNRTVLVILNFCVARIHQVSAILTLHVSLMLPPSFGLIWLTVWEQMSFRNFQAMAAILDIAMEQF